MRTNGRWFDIVVSVSGVPTTYLSQRWSYLPPSVFAVSPATAIPPNPAPGDTFIVTGVNFGALPGRVSVGARPVECDSWTDSAVSCVSPQGVVAAAAIVIVSASGQSSLDSDAATGTTGTSSTSVSVLRYRPPVVSRLSRSVYGSRGGEVLTIWGTNFYLSPPAPPADTVSVWLARGAALPSPPWQTVDSASVHRLLRCVVVTATNSSVSCVVPPGTGVAWRVVVANHDPGVNVSTDGAAMAQAGSSGSSSLSSLSSSLSSVYQLSSPSRDFAVSYDAPNINSVVVVPDDRVRPAAGNFTLQVNGTNFGRYAPAVTVGGWPCAISGDGSHSHDWLRCTAPPRYIDVSSSPLTTYIDLVQDGQSAPETPFQYNGPVVTAVSPLTFIATDASRPQLVVTGVNFGEKPSSSATGAHVVHVGTTATCSRVVWLSDNTLTCTIVGTFPAGRYPVTVQLGDDVSPPTPASTLTALCPVDMYGRSDDSEACKACPVGALCSGGDADPVSQVGYYPLARASFVECSPPEACVGGVNGSVVTSVSASSTVSCSDNYAGPRCAQCAQGSYRLSGTCHKCPNTAWLLFLLFSLAIVAAVAVAVYLSKKKINFAVLSIGVVSRSWVNNDSG